ncbi:hypothetical protein E2C01_094431 [Portunus trituberculatus]|uniref:Uncharacterized protein n=1 Tax=Portunus trituberculatus TaxID=210409 RepID=A0A5B7K0N9_PORTR|nr:hypothetical protein [Portunus trituberculatus]
MCVNDQVGSSQSPLRVDGVPKVSSASADEGHESRNQAGVNNPFTSAQDESRSYLTIKYHSVL